MWQRMSKSWSSKSLVNEIDPSQDNIDIKSNKNPQVSSFWTIWRSRQTHKEQEPKHKLQRKENDTNKF